VSIKHIGEHHWYISLDLQCPYCDAGFDITDISGFADDILGPSQICEAVKDCKIECPCCYQDFTFDIGRGM